MALDGELELDFTRPAGQGSDEGSDAEGIARGVCRSLAALGYATLTEMRLGSGRRVDVIGLDRHGGFAIVEVKASTADFRADRKWPEYLRFCDRFYFAVAGGFPLGELPDEAGIIVADRFGGALVRPAPTAKMNSATRRAQMLRFARYAAARLRRAEHPDYS